MATYDDFLDPESLRRYHEQAQQDQRRLTDRLARAVPQRPAWHKLVVDGDIVHIVPTSDSVRHAASADCVCGPDARLDEGHEGHDHPDIWVHQHHALDGRALPHLR